MHAADIKALLAKRGYTQARIVRDGLEASRSAVSRVIAGTFRSGRIAIHISMLTGKPVAELWPGKYPALEAKQARQCRGASNTTRRAA